MRRLLPLAMTLAAVGCGDSAPPAGAPLTAEQSKAIKDTDDVTDDAERGVDAGLKGKRK